MSRRKAPIIQASGDGFSPFGYRWESSSSPRGSSSSSHTWDSGEAAEAGRAIESGGSWWPRRTGFFRTGSTTEMIFVRAFAFIPVRQRRPPARNGATRFPSETPFQVQFPRSPSRVPWRGTIEGYS